MKTIKMRLNTGSAFRLTGALLASLLLVACAQENKEPSAAPVAPAPAAETAPATENTVPAYPERAYFGDTHVHTGWSADAGMDGAILNPDDAYRFALGNEVTSNSGLSAQLKRPFDWFMVTDHSDGMGVINEVIAGNAEMMESDTLRGWRDALTSGDQTVAAKAKSDLIVMQTEGTLPPQVTDPKWMKTAWEKTIAAAEKYYAPGEFTTFIAFEWTVNANGGNNLHRNVIFRDGGERAGTILPLTTFETQDPEKLWAWMAAYEESTGGRVLAIPHNGNLSNGQMFEEQRFDGTPMTPEWAAMRQKYEPLYEITQIKGQSETHPTLSPNDEFANWDLWDSGNLIVAPKKPGDLAHEYWRQALQSGMRLEDELGTNPFKYGANAGTDAHTGLSAVEEDNFFGKFKSLEPRPDRWDFPVIEGPAGNYMGWEQASSGVFGVWATENTREAIWDAMMRRETYATTGPRMSVRFFGGFDFSEADLANDFIANGYANGVPMGGDLSAAPDTKAPTFIVAATKDPEGANLDRVQIVKGWIDGEGQAQEVIYDVSWSGDREPSAEGQLPAVGNTVNLEDATYTNAIGEPELVGVFRDPNFDATQKAFYYVRVLEIPTPRWTLYDKVRFGVTMDEEVPMVHQERAFSSPIWYSPMQ